MPIRPIDLQTLFMQLNQVNREQTAGKEGAALQQAVQAAVTQKQKAEEAKGVRKPDVPHQGAEGVRDRGSRAGEEKAGHRNPEPPESEAEKDAEAEVITDPELGGHIDISG